VSRITWKRKILYVGHQTAPLELGLGPVCLVCFLLLLLYRPTPVLPDSRARDLCWDFLSIVSLVCLDYVLPVDGLSLAIFARRLSLHSVHASIPLSSSDIGPFNYILNSAQSLKLVAADFVSKRFPMYRPYYLHLSGSERSC
jgi:hypothetical protein